MIFPKSRINSLLIPRINETLTSLEYVSKEQILNDVVPLPKSSDVKKKIKEFVAQNKKHMIQRYISQVSIAQKFASKIKRGEGKKQVCFCCWIDHKDCFCNKLGVTTTSNLQLDIQLHVYMHYKELFRTSNSAKTCLASLEGSQWYIEGVGKQMAELELLLNRENTVVLYPSKNSVTVSEYLEKIDGKVKMKDEDDEEEELEGENASNGKRKINLVLVDGTYSNVQAMVRRILKQHPSTTFIKLNETQKRSEFVLRKQTKEREESGKISSLEATAYCIEQLLGSSSSSDGIRIRELLLKNLRVQEDTIHTVTSKGISKKDHRNLKDREESVAQMRKKNKKKKRKKNKKRKREVEEEEEEVKLNSGNEEESKKKSDDTEPAMKKRKLD